jgi:type IV pilus biogenesis protein CpaD/CtpE
MRNLVLAILLCAVLSGCATTCKDTVTYIPVDPKASVKVELPPKPALASSLLTVNSGQDEVIKAALSDLISLKSYSESLERLIK